jgi:hypothetical protein
MLDGYLHLCRRCKRKGTPHEEKHTDCERRRCPKCGEPPQTQPPEQPARGATAGFAAPVLRHDAIRAKGKIDAPEKR